MDESELANINQQNRMSMDDLNLLSTKHFFYGHVILKVWKQKLLRMKRKSQEASLELGNPARNTSKVNSSQLDASKQIEKHT